ncbi:TRAP transporter small permease [Paracoccus pantotrophus]|uniref:TRAP transporter small permease n=1 Tax=Paracoccus pantotrophus TaxID=82367 RepID=UPI0004B76B01|nr:TRAP transporter small permease [Paracoccus pantotrophus]
MNTLYTINRWIANALLALSGIAVVVLMLHVVADVLSKYAFHYPLVGTIEVASWYYMIAIAFFPLAYVQLHSHHLVVEVFTTGLSARRLAALDALVCVAVLAYIGLLGWLVAAKAIEATHRGEIINVVYFDLPIWPARWILPISLIAMIPAIVMQLLANLRFALTGEVVPGLSPDVESRRGAATA